MFVKICGLTDRAALDAAVAAGADALGFVFADSVREIEPAAARGLCAGLPPGIVRVAVMHHPDPARFRRVIEDFDPDWIQTDVEDLERLELPAHARALPVFREGSGGVRVLPPRLLFEGRRSGSGTTADWDEARRLAARAELVLAGGLDADNVGRAIDYVKPFGVDVSSGVESTRGRKDPAKIKAFVARVRAAGSER